MAKYNGDQIKEALKAYFSLGSLRKAQNKVGIPKSTIHVWVKRLGTKIVDKRKGCKKPNRKSRYKSCDILKDKIKQLLENDPYRTIVLVHMQVNETYKCSLSSVRRIVKSLGLSRKRASRMLNPQSPERDKKIQEFCETIKSVPLEDIISIDEASFDTRMRPFYGYTPRGKRLVARQTNTSRDRHSIVCGVSINKVQGYSIVQGSVNTERFTKFLKRFIVKCPQKVVLMDNVAFHKGKDVLKILEAAGKRVIFVPPYSPQFNPIEHVFSSMKKLFRESRSTSSSSLRVADVDDFVERWEYCFQPQSWKKTFEHCLRKCLINS